MFSEYDNPYDSLSAIKANNHKDSSNNHEGGLFLKFGMGGAFSSKFFLMDFDLAIRSKSFLIGYSLRGLVSGDILLLGLVPIDSYTINAGTLRYVLRGGPFVLIAGGGIGGTNGSITGTSFCAMATLDLGLYLGPVGLNFSIEPVFSKKSFVLGSLNFCLLF
jgi:hypothetical protein